MKYLHNSSVNYHGWLTSRNCILDSRFILKITDYGVAKFRNIQGIEISKNISEYFWCSPESLRLGLTKCLNAGSQQSDTFSFSIIISELITRLEPYGMFKYSPNEIIEKLKNSQPIFRPSIIKEDNLDHLIDLMELCWEEDPAKRPNFNMISNIFKKFNEGR